jgi:predicted nucleotide-binding protein (sugar kinase/HSP70/actin superfamily)
LPFVVRQSPTLAHAADRILCPTLHMRDGAASTGKTLVETMMKLGIKRKVARRAFDRAWEAQQAFRSAYRQAGSEAVKLLEETGESGMVLAGRPYNVHDAGVSLSTARKLRENYGVNVLPIDALPVHEIDTRDINDNMFWEYGRRILAVAKFIADKPNLHIIYVTNFKCGPDSFVKGFVRQASGGKPFLTLQFDGHSNDAGMMTRCEAYLDSKGILRWWRKEPNQARNTFSKDGRCTSPRCPTLEQDSLGRRSVPSA